jgi:hypothetical protein
VIGVTNSYTLLVFYLFFILYFVFLFLYLLKIKSLLIYYDRIGSSTPYQLKLIAYYKDFIMSKINAIYTFLLYFYFIKLL